jgi:hypothetical protein
MTGYALANTAMMRGPSRRHLPVLLLHIGLEVAPAACQCRQEGYWVLPAADTDAAHKAYDILKAHGWKDRRVPHQFHNISIGLSPPSNDANPENPSHSERSLDHVSSDPLDANDPSGTGTPINPHRTATSSSSGGENEPKFPPNLAALAILKQVQERQKDRRETDPTRTDELIREARAGGVHGYGPAE